MKPFAIQARYVLPMDGSPPLAGGMVTIAGERIVAVGENLSCSPPVDLGDVALLPGLVNAHTHLEFSLLEKPLGKPGQSLPEWIRDVLSSRQQTADDEVKYSPSSAIQSGIEQSLAGGTTTIGEIATQEIPLPDYAAAGADVTVFRELLGLPASRTPDLKALGESHLQRFSVGRENISAGISPHAPYSVYPEIVRWAAETSHSSLCPVAMHLAESPEELELLAHGTGPFVELLQERGVWSPESLAEVSRPLDYLKMLSRASHALIIHGNYLQSDELEYLAQHSENMTLVYCPRTHAYFGHAPYPLREALQLGVSLAIGTDSRASNPDLSLLSELRFIADRHPEFSPEVILQLGTIGGAKALGREETCGTISTGKLANLTAIELSDSSGTPLENLLNSAGKVRETWCRGKSVYQAK